MCIYLPNLEHVPNLDRRTLSNFDFITSLTPQIFLTMGILSTLKKMLPALFLMGVLFTACDNDDDDKVLVLDEKTVADYDHEVALKWNEVFLEIERYAAGYRPGPAPRALAYMGLASYEACAPGMEDHKSIASQYPGLSLPVADANEEYHWPAVVNTLRANLTRRFFRNASQPLFEKITTLENALGSKYRTQTSEDVYKRSVAHGQAVADAMWAWSATDLTGHEAYLDPFKGYNWADYQNKPVTGAQPFLDPLSRCSHSGAVLVLLPSVKRINCVLHHCLTMSLLTLHFSTRPWRFMLRR
jgi:hypothetical protein